MKLDIVTDTYLPDVNGVAMTLGRWVGGMRDRGHRVQVIHTGAEAERGDWRVASLPMPGYGEVRVGLPKPFDLRARWERKRPDAIYVATEGLLGKSAVKAARAMGIPVATGFHTQFHHFIDRYGLRGMRSFAVAYLRKFHARADATFTPSPEMVEFLRGLGIGHVRQVARGVDTELFSPSARCEAQRAEWGVVEGGKVVMMVGRVAVEKNFDLGMATFEAMRVADPTVVCVVVGDGPLRGRLQQACPWVHFMGTCTGRELARCYASADVLLFLSEAETFGNVLLEGMASGLATVSYDYAASAMHVVSGVNGLKVVKGDESGFVASGMKALAEESGSSLRLAARETVESLSWLRAVGDFERELERMIAEHRRVSPSRLRAVKRPRFYCRTVIVSDVHLGTPDAKADDLLRFLKHVKCEKLILNGDIIDGWALRRGGRWTSRHSRVIRKFIKMSEKDGVEVVYLRGNHDDILESFLPLSLGKIRVVKEHIHTSAKGRRYLVVHGDGFDSVSTHHQWLAVAGSVGYDVLLKINRMYNRWRMWRGKEYYSISKAVKARVKSAVSFVGRYEELLQGLAQRRKCDGIICGHIHTPEDKQVGGVHYLNSGDWVESMSAIIEHRDGTMEVVQHEAFLRRVHATVEGGVARVLAEVA